MSKELILDKVDDLVYDFVHYDRKEDNELPVGAIEKAIANGEIEVGDIISRFTNRLLENL